MPEPLDPQVKLREDPSRRMAVVRYSRWWSQKEYQKQKAALFAWMESKGLKAAGEPIWARYDPPFQLWFLRRNEVLVPVKMEAA